MYRARKSCALTLHHVRSALTVLEIAQYTQPYRPTLTVQNNKSHIPIFCWTAFSFDYGTHSPWHGFDKLLQCHNIYSCPELHYFFAKILYWWGSRTAAQSLLKSNHFYCHITTAHVPWWVKFLRVCSRQSRNNLHIDSTYLQTYTDDNVQNTHTYTQYTLYTI